MSPSELRAPSLCARPRASISTGSSGETGDTPVRPCDPAALYRAESGTVHSRIGAFVLMNGVVQDWFAETLVATNANDRSEGREVEQRLTTVPTIVPVTRQKSASIANGGQLA
jgi:hypothetical protein